MKTFYGHGKLMLTGEYLVLNGAETLALPTGFGQRFDVSPIEEPEVLWRSYDPKGHEWLNVLLSLPDLRLISATYDTPDENTDMDFAERLKELLIKTRGLNPNFLNTDQGYLVNTHLEFDRDWGLGSSSTLIYFLSQWANVDPYILLNKTFKGSGYDVACAASKGPLTYKLEKGQAVVNQVEFNPSFKKDLFFVHLNQKMNSRSGIAHYKNQPQDKILQATGQVDGITSQVLDCKSLSDFEFLMREHESILSSILNLPTVHSSLFSDFKGMVKSLGAWGGDFVLASGDPSYFKSKGYNTVIPYEKMIL